MFKNPLLIVALTLTGLVAGWGILDTQGLAAFAAAIVDVMFTSRGWFIMLTASLLLMASLWLALSRYGRIKLGKDDDTPEYSTISWLTMLFAAGMGVGLLYFGAAEPISHFLLIREYEREREAAALALFVTDFNWGLHAWAIYAVIGLVIAYFSYRQGCPTLISAPIQKVFGVTGWTKIVGWFSDLMAIVAIAIGLGGSIALGVFQVQGGIEILFDVKQSGLWLAIAIFAVLCVSYIAPLMVDLNRGMAVISNVNMATASLILVFVLLTGPTHYLMNAIVESLGRYAAGVLPHGFRTFAFADWQVEGWFKSWTLTYMVWWLAWAPFVGVFIARISKGRTIREFILGVVFVPTAFSIVWFGVFGGLAFFEILRENQALLEVVKTDINSTVFFLFKTLPLSPLMTAATVIVAFLFIVTSVVSAAFVLAMFSTGGDLNPRVRVKLAWGAILGALGLVMILSNSIDAVRSIIALGAMPFVFIVLLLLVCFLKALKAEAI